MPKVEGRPSAQPRIGEMFHGVNLILRVDDKRHPLSWYTVEFTPTELGELFSRYLSWLESTNRPASINAFYAAAAGGAPTAQELSQIDGLLKITPPNREGGAL